ncbi:uncharacterized protein LOC105703175 [Orussus abietinus]|uniref:uncharacterized protein LOC105703175 n=1 Tax=Orussus abietinus TaxID=222816 RepID=UPI000625FBF3|nr:uncharacterized protein LOC105703175 [Orussus abietinus]
MAAQSRKILNAITKRINKSPLFNNATSAIGNATERAQEKLTTMQSIACKKYDTIVKHVNGATIIQDINVAALQPAAPLPKHLVNWWHWYQQLTGLDTIEVAKQQVIKVQDNLFKCQDQRRSITRQAVMVNEKLKEIYAELIQTKRDDPKYVQLTIMENKGLQEQARLHGELNLLEIEERDHFTQLTTAIKEYHDSQAMNAQKYKYLSILASALLALVSLAGSMVYNNRRIVDVRNVITEAQKSNEKSFRDYFSSLENATNQKFREVMTLLEKQTEGVKAIKSIYNTEKIHKPVEQDVKSASIDSIKTVASYGSIVIIAWFIFQRLTGN